ncbi:MAG: adenosine kinase [Bacteriovoracaceae bacterium]|jgi:sugar/nucleoside kinase (ribokinase family)|nr:adenosine kinase [Bacteriovoracaceae bacterium]
MSYDVYGIGNALVDMEFEVSDDFLSRNNIDKGLMTLVEEDRQDEILAKLPSGAKRQCGGSAANTIIAISQFGGKSFYSCKVANDESGKFYLDDLNSNHVDTKLTADTAPSGTTGKCMVLVTKDAQRTMNTYLGITGSFSDEQLDFDKLKKSNWLYVEGYLVASETGVEAALKALQFAKDNNIRRALTLSDPNMVKFFRENFNKMFHIGIDLLFCNEDEAMEFTGAETIDEAKEKLKSFSSNYVITLGKNGAVSWDGSQYVEIKPYVVDAIDTNGAGDMFAGAYLYGLTSGKSVEQSGKLASYACAKIVSRFGPRLDLQTIKEVHKEILG